MKPLVYIILVNYNNYDDTIECIESLQNIEYDNFKIIIVENNSENNSEEILQRKFPKCEIIQTGINLGFAGGNNVGIKSALENKAEYILLLNNDTVVDKYFLGEMVECFDKKSNVGLVGGKIVNYYNRDMIDSVGGYIDYFKFITIDYNDVNVSSKREVNYLSGCLMLVKSTVFNKIGFLPEEYFMYYEDTDFCIKVKEAGYTILCNPKSVIYHKISNSSGGKESPFAIKWSIRNRLIFMKKYKYKVPRLSYVISIAYFYVTRICRYLGYKFKKDSKRANAVIEGIISGMNYNKHNL